MDLRLLERDRAEIKRSAAEARKILARPFDGAQIGRCLKPPADTPYGLEYAFRFSGDVKAVLDLGCGNGENIVPLLRRGACVIGIDISPDLIAVAHARLSAVNVDAVLRVGSAYETGLPDESLDVIFCMALIHHLDIKLVREEMWRVLRNGGVVILKEPIRFSKAYAWLRNLLPKREDVSEFEHPLSREELATAAQFFSVKGTRYFRLAFVPLVSRILPSRSDAAWRASDWILRHWPAAKHYGTTVVTKLQKIGDRTLTQ